MGLKQLNCLLPGSNGLCLQQKYRAREHTHNEQIARGRNKMKRNKAGINFQQVVYLSENTFLCAFERKKLRLRYMEWYYLLMYSLLLTI